MGVSASGIFNNLPLQTGTPEFPSRLYFSAKSCKIVTVGCNHRCNIDVINVYIHVINYVIVLFISNDVEWSLTTRERWHGVRCDVMTTANTCGGWCAVTDSIRRRPASGCHRHRAVTNKIGQPTGLWPGRDVRVIVADGWKCTDSLWNASDEDRLLAVTLRCIAVVALRTSQFICVNFNTCLIVHIIELLETGTTFEPDIWRSHKRSHGDDHSRSPLCYLHPNQLRRTTAVYFDEKRAPQLMNNIDRKHRSQDQTSHRPADSTQTRIQRVGQRRNHRNRIFTSSRRINDTVGCTAVQLAWHPKA